MLLVVAGQVVALVPLVLRELNQPVVAGQVVVVVVLRHQGTLALVAMVRKAARAAAEVVVR